MVLLHGFGRWVDIITENDLWYAVVAPDGVNTFVLKEKSLTKVVEE